MAKTRKKNFIAKALSDPIFKAKTVESKVRKNKMKKVPSNKLMEEAEEEREYKMYSYIDELEPNVRFFDINLRKNLPSWAADIREEAWTTLPEGSTNEKDVQEQQGEEQTGEESI